MNGEELAEWEPVQEEGQQLAGEAVGEHCGVVIAVHLQKRIITGVQKISISLFELKSDVSHFWSLLTQQSRILGRVLFMLTQLINSLIVFTAQSEVWAFSLRFLQEKNQLIKKRLQ